MAVEEIFYNDDNYYNLEEIKQYLYATDDYDKYESEDDVSDEDAWDYIILMQEDDWNETKRIMNRAAENATYIIGIGSLGLWDGTAMGGFLAETMDNAIYKMLGRDCEPSRVYMEDGNLHFESKHHDGRNDWVLRGVTDAGYEYYSDWSYYNPDNPDRDLPAEQITLNIFNNDEYSFALPAVW